MPGVDKIPLKFGKLLAAHNLGKDGFVFNRPEGAKVDELIHRFVFKGRFAQFGLKTDSRLTTGCFNKPRHFDVSLNVIL